MVCWISLKGRKAESSEGIEPELRMIMTCFSDGRTGDGDERASDGTICFNRGMCDRAFKFGVVINTFVPDHQYLSKRNVPTARNANSSSSSL